MKLKKFSAAALAALTVTMMSAAPVLAADDIEVNEDISVSGDYDWKRFANDHITLNVYNNGLYISDGSDESINVLSAFEELTGIKVNYTTYDSNESLYAKLKSGGVSYDVIFPSDYMVGKMAKEGMLSELNMDNIPNFAGIGETYLDRSFDPGNKYSVPYMWGTTGLIYNTTMVEEPPTKWADMWDVAYTNNVLMFNNSRDAYAIAAKTIGLSMNPQSVDEITAITDALKAQKNIVQAYVMDEVFDKMEGGEAAMAPYYAGDAITMIDENPDLAFVHPEEGVNFFIDSMCIPANAITPERVAINLADASIPDNAGDQPVDEPIRKDGAPAYFTSLPVKAMVQKMRAAGIPAALSYTAGSFVCNSLMYTLLYLIDRQYPAMRGGFIHVPYAMEQAVSKPLGTPSMELHQIARGLALAVEAVVENERDLTVNR